MTVLMGTETIKSEETENDLVWRWHDNVIYGVRFDLGEPGKQDWRSNLVFDIDFIAEWLREPSGEYLFRVAPATLTFHDVGDLSILIDQGNSEGRNAMTECTIDSVTRKRLDRTFDFWHWIIKLNMPAGGRIEFCASGFSQTLREAPRLVGEQRLPRGERHK